jgi:hypothetical protein
MSDDLAGKKVRCASCQSVVTAPTDVSATEGIRADAPPQTAGTAADRREPDDDGREPRRRRRSGGDSTGAAVAAAGAGLGIGAIVAIILGIVGLLGCCGVVAVMIGLMVPAVQKVRDAAGRVQSQNNLRQMALACQNYHDMHGMFPTPKALKNPNDTKATELSWRVTILPLMEQQALFNRFDMGAAWNSPQNQPLINTMPMPYHDVTHDVKGGAPTTTPYQYFTGPNTLWPDNGKHTIMEITAGTSNTFLCGESGTPVPWTRPQDMVIQAGQPLPLPQGRFQVAMCDGSVKMINRANAPDPVLLQYMNPKDNNPHPNID